MPTRRQTRLLRTSLFLTAVGFVCGTLTPVAGTAGSIEQVTVGVEDDAAITTPAVTTLSLDRPAVVEWSLTEAARQVAASFEVRFADAAPFADPGVETGAASHAVLGPLVVDAEVGSYSYEVRVIDAGGNLIAAGQGSVVVQEFSGIPRKYFAIGALVLAVFLLFNYIEAPLTRSYEEAH